MKIINKFILYLLFSLNVLIWGSSWASVKFLLESYKHEFGSDNPFQIAGMRYLIAGFLILPVALRHIRKNPLNKTDYKSVFYYGLFLIAFSNALVFWSQLHLPSSLCSIIFSLYPVMILLLNLFFIQEEKPNLLKVLGTLVSFIGIIVLFFDPVILNQKISILAFLTMVFSVFFAAFPSVLIRKNSIQMNVFVLNSLGMLLGGLVLIIAAFFIEAPLKLPAFPKFWLVLLYLAVFASCYTLIAFFWLMRHVQLSKLSLSAYLTPIVSLIIGVAFYKEVLNIQSYTGMILIFTGIFLIDYMKYRRIIYGTKNKSIYPQGKV